LVERRAEETHSHRLTTHLAEVAVGVLLVLFLCELTSDLQCGRVQEKKY